jgi:hypothetical protein
VLRSLFDVVIVESVELPGETQIGMIRELPWSENDRCAQSRIRVSSATAPNSAELAVPERCSIV